MYLFRGSKVFNYSEYSLHMDGEPLDSCAMFNESKKDVPEFTFQKRASNMPVLPKRFSMNLLPRRNSEVVEGGAVKKKRELQTELLVTHNKVAELKKENKVGGMDLYFILWEFDIFSQKLKRDSPVSLKKVQLVKRIGKGAGGEVYQCFVNGMMGMIFDF